MVVETPQPSTMTIRTRSGATGRLSRARGVKSVTINVDGNTYEAWPGSDGSLIVAGVGTIVPFSSIVALKPPEG